MPVKHWILAPFVFLFLLPACSADQPNPQAAASPTTQAAGLGATPTAKLSVPTTTPLPEPASSTPHPTVRPVVQSTASLEPATFTPPPSPTGKPDQLQVISGQTEEGAFFLGDQDAPITIIDYSDFL